MPPLQAHRFSERFDAARAEPGRSGSWLTVGHVAPAALALDARRPARHATTASARVIRRARALERHDLRHAEQRRQEVAGSRSSSAAASPSAATRHLRRQVRGDRLVLALLLRAAGSPRRARPRGRPSARAAPRPSTARGPREQRHVHRRLALARQHPPQLVHRHRQDRRQQARQAVDDDEHRGLARAARLATWRRTCTSGPWSRRRRTRSGPR